MVLVEKKVVRWNSSRLDRIEEAQVSSECCFGVKLHLIDTELRAPKLGLKRP